MGHASATLAAAPSTVSAPRQRQAVRDALRRGVAAVRLPRPATSTARCAPLARAGLRRPSATGHAIGRSSHEVPTLRPGGTTRLAPGWHWCWSRRAGRRRRVRLARDGRRDGRRAD